MLGRASEEVRLALESAVRGRVHVDVRRVQRMKGWQVEIVYSRLDGQRNAVITHVLGDAEASEFLAKEE